MTDFDSPQHPPRVEFREFEREFVSLVAQHRLFLAAAVIVATLVYAATDYIPDRFASLFVALVVQSGAVVFVSVRLLTDRSRQSLGPRKLWAVVWSSLLFGLGVSIGFVFLILPGIMLMARWSISIPLIVVEDLGPVEALGTSWDRTLNSRASLLWIYVIAIALLAASTWLNYLVALPRFRVSAWTILTVTNLLGAVSLVVGVVLSCAIYCGVTRDNSQLEEVFD